MFVLKWYIFSALCVLQLITLFFYRSHLFWVVIWNVKTTWCYNEKTCHILLWTACCRWHLASWRSKEDFIHQVERATLGPGLYANTSKTKVMHINVSADCLTNNSSTIVCVEYLGIYTTYIINCWVGQAWRVSHTIAKVWKIPIQKLTKCVQVLFWGDSAL